MVKLQGEKVYLATLELEDCRKLWEETEFDFSNPTECFIVGFSSVKADDWFHEVQNKQEIPTSGSAYSFQMPMAAQL